MINISMNGLSAREQNIAKILNCIINHEDVSSFDIGKDTGLSGSTISRVLSNLKKKSIINNAGKETTVIGRRPELVRLNKDYGHIVIFDVFQDKIVTYLADLNDKVIGKEELTFEEEITLDVFKKSISDVYGRLIKDKYAPILAAGISVPGVVNEEDNTISRIPNIFSFNKINLTDFIMDVLNVPVVICNESSLMAVGLQRELYPQYDSLVYVSFTEPLGIGGGIIADGHLYQGAHYAAGEIGSMFVDIKNFDGEYESAGCMETIAGLGKLFYELLALIEKGRAKKLNELWKSSQRKKLSLDIIEQAVAEQDYDTQEVYDRYIKVWAIGIINIIALFDPKIVIIGGKIDISNKMTLEKIKHYVSKGTYNTPNIQLCEMGEKAALIGGLHIVKNKVFNNHILQDAIE